MICPPALRSPPARAPRSGIAPRFVAAGALACLSLAACENRDELAVVSRHVSSGATAEPARPGDGGRRAGNTRGAPLGPRDAALVDSARALLRAGQPWRATLLLAPAFADSADRPAPLVLAAAEAAAAWGGWSHVERLLTARPWLDTAEGGAGHLLLARAALERPWAPGTIDSAALAHAERAVAAATPSDERARRLVVAARARERAGDFERAATAYERSAVAFPELRDWMMLRAAAISRERTTRTRFVAALRSDVARERAPIVEAMARELFRDYDGAATAYDAAGERVQAMRIRLERDDAARAPATRPALFALIEQRVADGGAAIALADRFFAPLTPREQLVVARAGAAGAARSAGAYAAAAGAGLLTASDHLAYGGVLARLGRWREAAAAYADASRAPELAPEARFQRARALLRIGGAGSAELARVAADFPGTAASGSALFLLGDMADDAGRDAEARRRFREVVRVAPTAPIAPRAAMRGAIIAYASGDVRTAQRELQALASAEGHEERSAARYWRARADRALGAGARATEEWRALLRDDPTSYYAVLAAARLGVPAWRPPEGARAPRVGDVEQGLERAARLDSLGMRVEAALERDRLARLADSSATRLVATAEAFRARGIASRGIHLAVRAWNKDAPRDEALFRVLHPFAFESLVRAESRARGLEPELVAALIRQESNFTPGATSRAGARGLMQVMPAVGGAMAKARRFPIWDPALLWQPDVSIQLGTAHLASEMKRYGDPARVLAAYNAGGSRVKRWARKAGASDPELFVERIPFVETRDYVRIVLRNRSLYRALYAR